MATKSTTKEDVLELDPITDEVKDTAELPKLTPEALPIYHTFPQGTEEVHRYSDTCVCKPSTKVTKDGIVVTHKEVK